MNWAGKQHPFETIVEWLAPLPLALAVGWAGKVMGMPDVARIALAIATLTAGFAAMKLIGGNRDVAGHRFDLTPVEAVEPELGELLLEAKDEVLELNDRLGEPDPDSRVVRLFAKAELTPGELVDRISDFLGEGRRPTGATVGSQDAVPPADASAALHAALANIRASLR